MMRKRLLVLCIAAYMLIAACFCGCDAPAPATTTSTTPSTSSQVIFDYTLNSLPYLVQIDGIVYQCGEALDGSVEIAEEQIAGYTTYSGPEIPDADGESNFVPVGTPYAHWSSEEYPDTYIILFNSRWHILFDAEIS